jgi:hypothetical protein
MRCGKAVGAGGRSGRRNGRIVFPAERDGRRHGPLMSRHRCGACRDGETK